VDESAVALEEALIAELRIAQAIAALAECEREVLRQDNPAALAEAACCQAGCQAELLRLRALREAATAAWGRRPGVPEALTFAQVLKCLDAATALRLQQYHQGILAHLEHAQALHPGNRALARISAGRHSDWRQFLLQL
jgi:hypothetical protein